MKLLIDFRSYQISKNRGIGRYILALTEELTKLTDIKISCLISQKLSSFELPLDIQRKVSLYVLENFSQYNIKDNFDFFVKGNFFDDHLCSDNDIYPLQVLQKCNDVVGILYDLIPLVYAGNYLRSTAKTNYAKCFELMKYASHFFCISKNTMNDGIKYLNRSSKDFTNIYGSTDEHKFHTINSEKPYVAANRLHNVIFTSGGAKYKNYCGAAKAFAMAYETGKIPQDAKLYLICAINDSFEKEVENAVKGYKAKIGKQIIITGYISDAELVDLLTTATASIFPSFYEGLGLPILESYIAGTPCFASNCSSTKELVMKEASFDPHNTDEICNAIIRIFNDEELCKKSLAWGRKLLKKINWHNSAQTMLKKLEELKANNHQNRGSKIAVFTILPPTTSGIAPYSYKTHIAEPEKYDMFSNIQNLSDYMLLQENNVKNVFPLDFYNYANLKERYKAEMFVFGNSFHHKKILDYAIKTKDCHKNRFMYLHEAFLANLFKSLYNNDLNRVRDFLKMWYPEHSETIAKCPSLDTNFLLNMKIYGIRPLINLTGIKHIFVNTQKAKQLIEEELTEQELSELTIDVFFLPLMEIKAKKISLRDNRKQKVIGTFGMPNPFKMYDEIYQAVKWLNGQGQNIKLIFAGYHCNTLSQKMSDKFVEIYDAPTDDVLYSLMNSVDLAIQLRKNSTGESSGCISQLLNLGKNILTTEDFIPNELIQYCRTIQKNVDVKKLGEAILSALQNPKKYAAESLTKQYSYQTLSEKIAKTIDYYVNNEEGETK